MANNIKGITITIGGNTVNLQKALKDVNKNTMSLQSELTQINRQLHFDPSNAELLSQKQKVLAESVEASKEKLRELNNVQQDIERAFKDGEIDNGQYRAYQREVEQTKNKIKDYEGQLRHVNTTQKDFEKEVTNAKNSLAKNKQELKDAAKHAAKWSAAVAGAAAGAGLAVLKMASEFETAYAKVTTLLDDTTDLDAYKADIINLSNELGIAANDTAEAVYQALSASVDQDKAVGFVHDAFQLTKGGFTELTTSVDVLTTAMNAYGISADKVDRISDVLITTQNLGKTTVDQLAAKMGRVIPTAAAYNVSLENIGAAYSLLTKRGVTTANATTQIRSLLNALAQEGKTVKKQNGEAIVVSRKLGTVLKEETGKSFSELSKEGKGLGDILQILMGSVHGNTDEFAKLFSNVNAKAGALALLKSGTEEYNSTLKKMTNSEGAAEKAYQKMSDTAEHRIEVIKTNIQNSLIKIGDKMLPKAKEFLDEVEDRLPEIEEAAENIGDLAINTITWTTKNGKTLLFILKQMGLAIGVYYATVKSVAAYQKIMEMVKAYRVLKTATDGATSAQLALNTAGKANVIGAIIAAAVVLTSTLWDMYHATAAEKNKVNELTKAEKEHLNETKEMVKTSREQADARAKSVDSINSEFSHYQKLSKELDGIVSKNGKVKDGYKDRAQFIVNTLADKLGLEIKLNGDIVEGYKKIRKEIKKTIQTKKLAAQQEAFSADYQEAIKAQTANENRITVNSGDLEKRQKTLRKLKRDRDKYQKAVDEWEKTGNNPEKAQEAFAKLPDLINTLIPNAEKNVKEAQKALDAAILKKGQDKTLIQRYEKLSEQIEAGKYNEAAKTVLRIQGNTVAAKYGTKQILEKEVADAKAGYEQLKKAWEDGNKGVSKSEVENKKYVLSVAKAALSNYKKAHKNAGKGAANSQAEGYKEGANDPKNIEKVTNASSKLLSAANNKDTKKKAKTKGKGLGGDFANGFIEGLKKKFDKAFNTGMNFAGVTLKGVQKGQDSGSPAKKAMPLGGDFADGYIIGIDNKESDVRKSGNNLAVSALNALNVSPKTVNVSAGLNAKAASAVKEAAGISKTSKTFYSNPSVTVAFGDVTVKNEQDINLLVDKVTNRVNENLATIILRERSAIGK